MRVEDTASHTAELPRTRQRARNTGLGNMNSPSVTPQGSDDMIYNEDRAVRAARRREKRRLRSERAEWWSTKLHALLWVVAAVIAVIVSDFINVCLKSELTNRIPLGIGLALFGLVVIAIIRMAFWFPSGDSESTHVDFDKAHPIFTLVTTFGGIFSFIFLTIGLWPVYRIFAPFLLILIWFGMIMSLHFIP